MSIGGRRRANSVRACRDRPLRSYSVGVADPAVVRARGVARTFDVDLAPVRALRGVDLDLHRGEFVALTGPSGSGKSTLVQILAGLDRPDDGTVCVAGQDLRSLDENGLALLRRRHIGLVFQFFHLIEHMTSAENVELAALAAGEGRRTARRRAGELLDQLGLLDKARTFPAALSGGQRQRLAIARALINRPSVLLADEPTGALDSNGVSEVLELLGRLRDEGQAILVVTHDGEVAAAADRLVLLRDGATPGSTAAP
jgi:putative ABC transport system ATP-binding protein